AGISVGRVSVVVRLAGRTRLVRVEGNAAVALRVVGGRPGEGVGGSRVGHGLPPWGSGHARAGSAAANDVIPAPRARPADGAPGLTPGRPAPPGPLLRPQIPPMHDSTFFCASSFA